MNLIGIDFEDWYHPELVQKHVRDLEHEPSMFKGLDKISWTSGVKVCLIVRWIAFIPLMSAFLKNIRKKGKSTVVLFTGTGVWS